MKSLSIFKTLLCVLEWPQHRVMIKEHSLGLLWEGVGVFCCNFSRISCLMLLFWELVKSSQRELAWQWFEALFVCVQYNTVCWFSPERGLSSLWLPGAHSQNVNITVITQHPPRHINTLTKHVKYSTTHVIKLTEDMQSVACDLIHNKVMNSNLWQRSIWKKESLLVYIFRCTVNTELFC